MTEQGFDSEKIRTVFIKMCTKSMPESMTGKSVFPAELAFLCKNKLVDRTVRKLFFFLKPADKITQFRPGDILWQFMQDF